LYEQDPTQSSEDAAHCDHDHEEDGAEQGEEQPTNVDVEDTLHEPLQCYPANDFVHQIALEAEETWKDDVRPKLHKEGLDTYSRIAVR
jgi:hypothetical protein